MIISSFSLVTFHQHNNLISKLFGKIKIHFEIFVLSIRKIKTSFVVALYCNDLIDLSILYYIIEKDSTMLRKFSVIFQSILLLGLLLQVSSQWTRWGSWSSCTNLRQSRERTLTKRQTRRCRGNLKLNYKALFSRSLFLN